LKIELRMILEGKFNVIAILFNDIQHIQWHYLVLKIISYDILNFYKLFPNIPI